MIDTLDPEFEKIYSERKDINLCCVECGDTGFQLGREFERNKTKEFEKENSRLREALEYCLPYLERMFSDIPEKLDRTFYLTLSYDGDTAEAEKIKRFRQILQGKNNEN